MLRVPPFTFGHGVISLIAVVILLSASRDAVSPAPRYLIRYLAVEEITIKIKMK